MFNLLTAEDRNAVRTEYFRRLVSVAIGMTLTIFTISLIILIPIFISISAASHNTKIELDAIKSKPASNDYRDLEKIIQESKRAIETLKLNMSARPHIAEVMLKALENKPKGISVESLSWVSEDAVIRLVVSGTADTRESLRKYVTLLQSNKSFSTVNIPVSSFAKAIEANFAITLEITKGE